MARLFKIVTRFCFFHFLNFWRHQIQALIFCGFPFPNRSIGISHLFKLIYMISSLFLLSNSRKLISQPHITAAVWCDTIFRISEQLTSIPVLQASLILWTKIFSSGLSSNSVSLNISLFSLIILCTRRWSSWPKICSRSLLTLLFLVLVLSLLLDILSSGSSRMSSHESVLALRLWDLWFFWLIKHSIKASNRTATVRPHVWPADVTEGLRGCVIEPLWARLSQLMVGMEQMVSNKPQNLHHATPRTTQHYNYQTQPSKTQPSTT